MAMLRPRTRWVAASGASRSASMKRSRSASTWPGSSMSWAMAAAVRLLPDPDSPTMPTRSFGARVKETSRTGVVTRPSGEV